jgi:hypothetical protein
MFFIQVRQTEQSTLYSDNSANQCELEERVQLASQRVGRCLERMGPATQASINIDIEVCDRCGGSVKVIACIDDQDVIDSILAHLREKEQGRPTPSYLVPPSRAPLGALPLFAGSKSTAPNQQGR